MKKILFIAFMAGLICSSCCNNTEVHSSNEPKPSLGELFVQVLVPLSHTPEEAYELIASYNDMEEEAQKLLDDLVDVENNLSDEEWNFIEASVVLYFEEHVQAFHKNWYGENVLQKEILEGREALKSFSVQLSDEQETYLSALSVYMVASKMPLTVEKWITFRIS